MLAAIQYPSWLKPELIPGLPFRWYGLMYVAAFGLAWLLFSYEAKRRKAPWDADEASSFFAWGIAGLLIGARLFGTLVYDESGLYWRKPWLIFWPFDEAGRFIGFQGMSFHGGFLGLLVGTLLFCRIKRRSWIAFGDIVAVSAPLGYTFGRLGNFINGELWGKVTTAPYGMIFPHAERFPASEAWVQEAARASGIPVPSMNALVNLPRHPSQLYEAFLEGLLLWALLWLFARKRKVFPGFATGMYAIGYGIARFVVEYVREPDAGLGYVLALGDPAASIHRFGGLLNFSMGQVLSFLMILGGALWLLLARVLSRRGLLAAAEARRGEGATGGGETAGPGGLDRVERARARTEARRKRKKLG